MPRQKSSPTTANSIGIQATSRQTRFDLDEETASKDLDLHTVNISIGKRDILNDSHLKLSPGVHYVLVGRNGVGKSTLLRAIGEKIIPGIQKSMRVLLLLQNYNSSPNDQGMNESVLEYVVDSDTARAEAMWRSEGMWLLSKPISPSLTGFDCTVLRKALDDQDPNAAARAVRTLKHEDRIQELENARKTAMLRSGTRGLKARKELKTLEVQIEEETLK